jgi:hypothetical protein
MQGCSLTTANFTAVRGQQVLAALLTVVPLAERMLLYNLLVVAFLLLPQAGPRPE